MADRRMRKNAPVLLAAFVLLILLQGVSFALDVYVRAEAFNKTMPGGTVIPMWGYSQCDATFTNCCAPTVPGPVITVPVGETLTVHLQNTLPEATSVMIPGQALPTGGIRPVRNPDGRVRSFVHETDPAGTGDYVWSTIQPGTYLYESGTHPAKQVQMGLYGALKKDTAAGEAYPGINYANEAVLLFSEVDPALHAAVVDGTYGTPAYPSTMNYMARFFLINGEPFSLTRPAVPVGAPGQDTLLRFLSAGLKTHTPVIQQYYVSGVAEDGNPYPFPKEQYSLSLHPGKTLDAVLRGADVPAPTLIPVFDRSLGLSNAGASSGGMLAYLRVGPVPLYTLTVVKSGTGTGTVQTAVCSTGIDCGADCTETYPEGTMVSLSATPDPGSYFAGWSGGGCSGTGICSVLMGADTTVTAMFNLNPVLTVVKAGSGTGTAQTDLPSVGIDCGTDCTESYPLGTVVTLSATPGPNSFFGGWSGGGCTGTGTCTVTMNADTTVIATFNLNTNVSVVLPNGGETWGVNTTRTIFWAYTGTPGANVRIELLRNGAQFQTIAASVPIGAGGLGSYNWFIPPFIPRSGTGIPLDTTYQIRVTSTTDGAITDTSDANFSIAASGIGMVCSFVYTLTPTSSPLIPEAGGAGSFTVTTQPECAWAATTAAPWITITSPAGAVTGSGVVNYTVGDNTGGPLRSGTISAGGRTFTVNQAGLVPPDAVTVVAPNGGEIWNAGSTRTIQWTYTGNVGPNVRIELLQNGVFSRMIAASVPVGAGGNGSYVWTLPARGMAAGSTFAVRVTSTTNGAITDMSDAFFTITP